MANINTSREVKYLQENSENTLSGDSDNDDNQNEEDWQCCGDEEDVLIHSKCLFCNDVCNLPEKCWEHMGIIHGVHIKDINEKFKLDCFSYIKMINYCRKEKVHESELMGNDEGNWQNEKYMMPVIEDDGLLQYDIESDEVTEMNEITKESHKTDLHAKQLEKALEIATENIQKMRAAAREMNLWSPHMSTCSDSVISSLHDDEDSAYFGSYGHFSIHQEMLKDKVRTKYYENCISKNSHLFKDKIVLDVGCGTAILSMFAAKAGARLVIGVEMSDIIYQAMDIVRENGLSEKITLIKGRMEDVTLPVKKVDIIISEWMGYFLLFESMLDTVLWARDHYLIEGGYILPDFASISILGMQDHSMHQENIQFWDNVYGFKMSCMRTSVLEEASVTIVEKTNVFTAASLLKSIDLMTSTKKELDFCSAFTLKSHKDTKLTALVAYFDISWNKCSESLSFSTSPFDESTHWKQTVFLLQNPVFLKADEHIEGKLMCTKSRKDPRSLCISITLNGQSQKFIMQ